MPDLRVILGGIVRLALAGLAALGAAPAAAPAALSQPAPLSAPPASPIAAQPRIMPSALSKPAPTETRPALRAIPRSPVPAAIPGVSIAADIPYVVRPGADPRQTSLDVYLPATASGLPALIYVRGGGWSSGDKADVGAKVYTDPQHMNDGGTTC